MRQSLEILRIEPPWSFEDLRQGARNLVEADRIHEALLRVTVTAGERPNTRGSATIASRELPEAPPQPALHVASAARRLTGPLSQCKSISRVAESVALREAQEEGAFDAILLNDKGRVAETTARNLFVVAAGVLWTPPTYDGALAGVTRAAVLEIAARQKIKTLEASFAVEQLRAAEEVFLTGSGVGVLGIAAVDGRRYATPGPMTRRVQTAYADLLETDSRW